MGSAAVSLGVTTHEKADLVETPAPRDVGDAHRLGIACDEFQVSMVQPNSANVFHRAAVAVHPTCSAEPAVTLTAAAMAAGEMSLAGLSSMKAIARRSSADALFRRSETVGSMTALFDWLRTRTRR